MKQFANKYQIQLIAVGFLAAFIYLQTKVQSILPAVMQDEYIYSIQARKTPLSELDYPNYLYSLVFSSTNQCGINYYSCAKNLNLLFFAGFVAIVFFIAQRFLGRWYGFALAMATALSPLGAYTSVFMPESMYFFFALASFVALWWASSKSNWWPYLVAGAALGLTSLVKPHALFLALAGVLFLLVVQFGKWKLFALSVSSFIAGLIVVKFGLGFALAGVNGLTLFGSSYTSSLNNFTENLTGMASESLSAGGAILLAAETTGPTPVDFVLSALQQFGWQSWAVLFLVGTLVAILIGSLFTARGQASTADDLDLKRFTQLSLISLGSMVMVISAFAAMVTILGDDHSTRLLLRYYEFLFIPIAIAAIAALKATAKQHWSAITLALASAGFAALGYALWLPNLRQLFADSPFMMGVTSSQGSGTLALVLAIVTAASLALAGKYRVQIISTLTIGSLAIFGYLSVDRLAGQANQISPIDSAGIFARDYLAGVDSEKIHFLGSNRQLTLASIFWLDKPDVSFSLHNPGELVDQSTLAPDVEWVVLLGDVLLTGDRKYQVAGQGWTVVRVGGVEEHLFGQEMVDSPVKEFSGLDILTGWGRWNSSGEITIVFDEPLPTNAKLFIEVAVGSNLAGTTQAFELGDALLPIQLGQAGERLSGEIEFTNTAPSDTLRIKLTDPTPQGLGLVSITVLD